MRRTWTRKPPIGWPIDRTHPLAERVMCFFPFWEGCGPIARDVVSGLGATAAGNPTWSAGASGPALAFNASGQYAQAPTLPGPSIVWPVTVACGFRMLGAPTATTHLIAIQTPSTEAEAVDLSVTTALVYRLSWLSGSTQGSATSAVAAAVGVDVVAAATFTTATQVLYVGGKNVYSTSNSLSNPTDPAPFITFGADSGLPARNVNYRVAWAGAWSLAPDASWHARLAANPWEMFLDVRPPGWKKRSV